MNAALATLSVSESANGDDLISIAASDSLGNVGAYTVVAFAETLSLKVNAPPLAHLVATIATAVPNVSLLGPGALAEETFTATLSVGKGILTATGTVVSGSGTANLTVTGSLDQVNAALATLEDIETVSGIDTIAVTASDSVGDLSRSSTLVSAMGLALSNNRPNGPSVVRGAPTSIPGVSLAGSGNFAGETFTVTLASNEGILGATGTGVSGSGTENLSINGTLDQVNAALATLTDDEPGRGSDTTVITATDSVGDAVTTPLVSFSVSLPLTIIAPTDREVSLGLPTNVPGVSLSEPGNLPGETFTASISVTTGTLAATGAGMSGSGTQDLTVSGLLDQVNADLGTLSETETFAKTDFIAFGATDSFGGSSFVRTVNITTRFPTLTINAPATLSEVPKTATSVPGLSLSEPGAILGETFTATDSFGGIAFAGTATTVNPRGLAFSAPASASVISNVTTGLNGFSLSEPDETTGETFNAALFEPTGILAAVGVGVTGSGTGTLTITVSPGQVNVDLATLATTLSAPGGGLYYSASDSVGDSVGQAHVLVTATPPDLSIQAPAPVTVAPGAATLVPGNLLSEPGNLRAETFTVTVQNSLGILTATGAGVTGSGISLLTISSALDQVNIDLATLSDQQNFFLASKITATASDKLGDTAPSLLIAVNPEPLTRSINGPAKATVIVGAPTAIPGISLTEPNNVPAETFTAVVAVSDGTLTATGPGSLAPGAA